MTALAARPALATRASAPPTDPKAPFLRLGRSIVGSVLGASHFFANGSFCIAVTVLLM